MAEVVDADAEVDSACRHCGEPDLGAEGVTRDRRADPRAKQQIVSSERFSADVRRNFVQPGLTDAECPRLVVLRVPLHDEALIGRRILLGRLDDGVLHTDHASQEVDVSWPQRDDLAPAHSGLNKRLDQQPMLRGQCATKDRGQDTWYFLIDRGERPSACALVTQSWTTEGETLFSCRLPNAG
jgi:hypothetical protein